MTDIVSKKPYHGDNKHHQVDVFYPSKVFFRCRCEYFRRKSYRIFLDLNERKLIEGFLIYFFESMHFDHPYE